MKRFLVIILLLLTIFAPIVGCGSRTEPRIVFSAAPGTPQQFDVYVFNGTLWTLELGPMYAGQPIILIPPGAHVIIPIGFLPSSVSVTVSTYAVPSYTYPTVVLLLGRDYGSTTTSVGVSFP